MTDLPAILKILDDLIAAEDNYTAGSIKADDLVAFRLALRTTYTADVLRLARQRIVDLPHQKLLYTLREAYLKYNGVEP